MFPLNDALDAILLGSFLFGLIFTVGVLLLGVADLGADHGGDAGDHGFFHGLFNVSSILAFITWFGGFGYVARNGLGVWAPLAVGFGLLGGLVAAVIVSWFVLKILRESDTEMDPSTWDQVGVIARVSSSIRSNGYGEIVYEQHGTRQVASAKGSSEMAIPRDTEVVILRVERGVAIVEPFEELLRSRTSSAASG
jgi:hypothetical protein